MPFIRSNSPSPSRSRLPSTCSAGNLFGTTRRSQPGAFGGLPFWRNAQHLGRRHVLVAGTERTVLGADDAGALETEVVGALAAIGGDDDPAAGDGIFAELRQWVTIAKSTN